MLMLMSPLSLSYSYSYACAYAYAYALVRARLKSRLRDEVRISHGRHVKLIHTVCQARSRNINTQILKLVGRRSTGKKKH